MFSKLSILLLYMKIFVPSRRGGVFWANQSLVWVNAMFYFGAVIALICQCIPRAKISNPTLAGRCTDVYLSFLISGVFNVLSDFFILVFPLWAIWHLQMPLKRKAGISFVFATGVLYVPLRPSKHNAYHFFSCLVPSSLVSCACTTPRSSSTIRTRPFSSPKSRSGRMFPSYPFSNPLTCS